jgi:hypothetical protein
MEAVTALTVPERDELAQCEAVIERGLANFMEVGQALLVVRDKKLYRLSHKTFAEYCSDRWQLGRAYAYQAMAAAEVTRNLSAIADILPTNEAQARPLAKLSAEQQVPAWDRAVEIAGGNQPTAAQVAEAVEEVRPTKRQVPVVDTFAPEPDPIPDDDLPEHEDEPAAVEWDRETPDEVFQQADFITQPAPIAQFPAPVPTENKPKSHPKRRTSVEEVDFAFKVMARGLEKLEAIDPDQLVRSTDPDLISQIIVQGWQGKAANVTDRLSRFFDRLRGLDLDKVTPLAGRRAK